MAKFQKRDRELQQLEKATREALRRSCELIEQTEKLVSQSRELIQFSTLRDPSHSQTREPKD